MGMACADLRILRSQSLKEGFAFLLAPMFHQGHEPRRVFALERQLILPLWIEQVLIASRRVVGFDESRIVAEHEHRDTVRDPVALRLDKTLIELLRERTVIGLDHSLAAEKFYMGVVGVENIGDIGGGLRFGAVALHDSR